MPKTIKEFQLNQSTGEVSVEYSDDSTSKFNAADMVTAQTDPVTGGISFNGIPAGISAANPILSAILARAWGPQTLGSNVWPAIGASWTIPTGWSQSGGVLIASGNNNWAFAKPTALTVVARKSYKATFTVTGSSGSGDLRFYVGGGQYKIVTTDGTYTLDFYCPNDAASFYGFAYTGGWTGSVSAVSMQEILSPQTHSQLAWDRAVDGSASIVCVGDSLTAGITDPWPEKLAAMLKTDRGIPYQLWGLLNSAPPAGNSDLPYIYKCGFGGARSDHVIARAGAAPFNIVISGGEIPASGAVAVTSCVPDICQTVQTTPNMAGKFSNPGVVAGVQGNLIGTTGSPNTYQFVRAAAGDVVSAPGTQQFWANTIGADPATAVAATSGTASLSRLANIHIIWIGQNNYDPSTGAVIGGADMMVDLNKMTSALTAQGKKYLVIGRLNGGTTQTGKGYQYYTDLIAQEAVLQEKYGDRFVNIRKVLIANYNPKLAQDLIDYSNDVVPASLRVDVIHPNGDGNSIIAREIRNRLVYFGWAAA